jgi:type II secretory pathway pseudopilin PulG
MRIRILNNRQLNGFALIATILLMVLLAIITIGTLSLSVVTLRTGTQDSAQARARANARMALMIAIGELQKQMGPDQRISANSAILEDSTVQHAHWLGVWNSWKAGIGEASQHSTIEGVTDEMAPNYLPNRSDYFRKWLISLNEDEMSNIASPKNLSLGASPMPGPDDDAIFLVADGSLGTGADKIPDYVAARILDIKDKDTSEVTGRYGWWIGDESQKARIMDDSYLTAPPITSADKIYRSEAPGSMGTKTISGLENVTDESQFAKIPSLATLDLIPNVVGRPSRENFFDATPFSISVLTDVREGGLKRDLSTILEQPINLSNSGDEYMLYRFGTTGEDRVPLQDLAAYYQLYQNDPNGIEGRRGGVAHNAAAGRVMQVNAPDLGDQNSKTKFLREYTSLYRNPVPIRVQFVLGVGATVITDAERTALAARPTPVILRATDKYKLLLGVKPVVSLWNPNNTPMVMGTDASQIMKVGFPPFTLRWKKYRAAGLPTEFVSTHLNLNYAISNESTGDGRARSLGPYIIQMQFARNTPIVFQPGEVKMFSIPIAGSNFLETGGNSTFGNTPLYQAQAFVPDGFYVTAKSGVPQTVAGTPEVTQFPNSAGAFINYQGMRMVFGDGDSIDFEVAPEDGTSMARAVSVANEITGAGFQLFMSDVNYVGGTNEHYRNYQFISRFGGSGGTNNPNASFNRSLMLAGFPNGAVIPYDGQTNAIPGSVIKSATDNGEAKGLLLFTMMSGAEIHSANSPGAGAGRRITTRPFLHGSTLSAPQIADNTRSALYDYGWEWQVERINEVEEAFQDDGSSRGYYGGGYTVGAGVTHVVQQYLPALPPISIASLSSAHLGGFSLANNTILASPSSNLNHYVFPPGRTYYPFAGAPLLGDLRQVTATGQGGLAPHNLQAIGNSYAHPNIPADKAFTTYTQLLNSDLNAALQIRPYADHSYLANKALWDEFYFSSIAPQLSNQITGGASAKTATEVANDFHTPAT